jgi:hypothetical protein
MTPEAVADYLLGEQIALDAVALADLAQQAGAELPEDYKSFLTLRNGGFTSPTATEQPPLVTRDGHAIEQFYCVTSMEPDWSETSIRNYRVMTLRLWLEETGGDPVNMPASWIVIGGNWNGDQFALDLSVPGGEVVWLDHELLPNEDDNSFPADDGVQRLGLTFAQFLEALNAPPSPPRSRGLLNRLRQIIGR